LSSLWTSPFKNECKALTNSGLEKLLAYQFNDSELLNLALTHRSYASKNNERFEFIGDGALNFVIALKLFELLPNSSEGDLSRLRANLVSEAGLTKVAKNLGLGDYIQLGSGELKSGGFHRASILSDTLEAIFGAIYCDAGFDACQKVILGLYREQLQSLPDAASLKDPKTRLQELLQSQQRPLPDYQVTLVSGEAHDQVFEVECCVDVEKQKADGKSICGKDICGKGKGSSRRKAEQQAAQQVLQILE